MGFFFSPSLQKAPLNLQAARVLTIWAQMVSHMIRELCEARIEALAATA